MIELKEFRKAARFTQGELAERLGLSQAQVSRYESDPESAPMGLVLHWLTSCGTDLASASRGATSALAINTAMVDPGAPYVGLHQQLTLLEQYVDSGPAIPDGFLPGMGPSDLRQQVRLWRRKPNLVLAGAFDAGKTRLANTLLGSSKLAAEYSPWTRVVTFIRHIEDRPVWQKEDVWMMGRAFDPLCWDDEEHCSKHRILAGSFDTLQQYGTHAGADGEKLGIDSALVYMAAPILRACNVIDFPGYDDKAEDEKRANRAVALADILVYLSTAKGFLKAADFLRLGSLVRALPVPELSDSQFPTLGHLFIVASQADPSINDQSLQRILDNGARRLIDNLHESVWDPRSQLVARTLDYKEVRARLYSFWVENSNRRSHLEFDICELLTHHMPRILRAYIEAQLQNIKTSGRSFYSSRIEAYQKTLDDLERAKQQLELLQEQEPVRQQKLAAKRAAVEQYIENHRAATATFISTTIGPQLNAESIEEFIVQNFSSQKDAKEYTVVRLIERTQSQLDRHLQNLAKKMKPVIDDYIAEYDSASVTLPKGDLAGTFTIPFDGKGAFLGGLAGAGALGALSLWAATLGNLGGYIIIAKLVSLLSAIGISVGGTAAAASIVAVLGGPITLAIGLGTLLALGAWALFGDSWQRRLAKKIAKTLQEKNFLGKVTAAGDQYWTCTKAAFEKGAHAVEEKYHEYLRTLNDLVGGDAAQSRRRIELLLKQLEDLRDFFGAIPWRSPI